MLRIRFSRVGRRNQPHFRIVVQEHTVKPTGKFIELLGSYDPRTKKRMIKADRVQYWLEHGAQTTATVHNLLVDEGIIKAPKLPATHEKPNKKEAEAQAEGETTVRAQEKESTAQKAEEKPSGAQEKSQKTDSGSEEKTDGKEEQAGSKSEQNSKQQKDKQKQDA